uniref:3-hydroxyacyl-CoA dehydrogenase n=1 Tax=Romanomermis culicivorax TaxID=13658 RepID=A0A915JUX8_ROMCU
MISRLLLRSNNLNFAVSKKFTTTAQSMDIKNVVIIGAGLMGSGIAQNGNLQPQISAQSGCHVTLVDQTEDILLKSKHGIEASLKRIAKKVHAQDSAAQAALVRDTMAKISVRTDISKAVHLADLVIEAVVENLDAKQKLFSTVESAAPSHALLASNTSSLPLSDIAQHLKRKDQFGGLHFFNPVPVMKLLEVIRTNETSDKTFQTFLEYGKKLDKSTVACKDTPGFIVNRLLVPYMLEAIRMLERGDASKEDIDLAMKLGAGYPMGPLELTDYVGLDTCKFIIDGWSEKYPDNALFKPSSLLDKLVREGHFGRKTGQGFYKY